ncbi:MAG TPA: phosphatase PAP2 family protein [Gaiellaceae bacterium]|nr:phosphatase PAP2 family protein [Gaiellaceae bacterium]
MASLDFRLEHDLNRYAGHHHTVDVAARHIAESQVEVAVVVVGLIAFGWIARRNALVVGGIAALAAAALALVGNVIVSSLWFRKRPFVAHPHVVHLIVHHPADASFPSDHAAALAGISVGLLAFAWRLGVVAVVWTLLVGLARVYVGEHYPGDVVGGYAIGVVAGLLVLWAVRSRPARAAVARLPAHLRTRLSYG